MGLPTVGAGALNIAQLPPRVRRILAHRAKEAARREYAPVLAADRGAFGSANQEYKAAAQSARGATDAVESTLAQALGGLADSGLSGKYLQQAKSEFTSRAADTASALPSMLAGAQEERAKSIGEARQQLSTDRAAMLQSRAAKFNSALDEERNAATSVLNARDTAREQDSGDEDRGLKNATTALKTALFNWSQNPPVSADSDETVQEALPLNNINEWRLFAEKMTHGGEGFDITDAMKAIHNLLKNRKKNAEEALNHGEKPSGLLGLYTPFNAG